MPEIIIWIIIGIVGLIAIAALTWFIIKLVKMKPEEREEVIIQILIGLVTAAENYFVGEGRGQEKIAWVQEQFNKTAPWFVKIVLMVTKTADFNELVKKALEQAKTTEWDKFKR
jgi:F0F1-type ATP synthase assembly protein I